MFQVPGFIDAREELHIATQADGNMFLFAYANSALVETCVSEGFHQIGGLKVSGYSARAERFFANFLYSGVCSGLELDLLAIFLQHKFCYKETIS